jgi:ribosomal protein S18 acetylase RimI-like enzyme
MSSKCTIIPVRSPSDLTTIKFLFTSYASHLAIDLTFQSFAEELESLPGKYAPPTGELLLALDTRGSPIGCVAIRPLALPDVPKCCEMKRLYVSPQGRGMGAGKALAEAVVKSAKELGYEHLRLDTLPEMTAAIGIYKALGFESCEKYYDTPLEGTVFLNKDLTKHESE